MKTFKLVRTVDLSGISGLGDVAEGVEFHDGQCVISWFGRFHSVAVYPSILTLLHVHGHNDTTKVVWDFEEQEI